jgi:hypothetical protein
MTHKTFSSRQEIFDYVTPLLFAQGERSMLEGGTTCAYRGEHGMRCAVGFLIPDELYYRVLEGKSAMDVDITNVLSTVITTDDDLGLFLTDLQDVHDGWTSGEKADLFDRFQNIAMRYKLDRTVLSSFGMVENPA